MEATLAILLNNMQILQSLLLHKEVVPYGLIPFYIWPLLHIQSHSSKFLWDLDQFFSKYHSTF